MRTRSLAPPVSRMLNPVEVRILWCLREVPCVLVPLRSIMNDVQPRSIRHALDSLTQRGFVFRRVRGRGCALIGEPRRP